MAIAAQNPQFVADQIAIDLKASGIEAAVVTTARPQKSDPSLPTVLAREYAKGGRAFNSLSRNPRRR